MDFAGAERLAVPPTSTSVASARFVTFRPPEGSGCLSFVPLPVVAYAFTDWYEDWIVWTPGAGQKPQVNCDSSAPLQDGYFAFAVQNIDHGSNTVSNDMKCANMSEHAPTGFATNHSGCQNKSAIWTAGYGDKPLAHCDNGRYAVGFSLKDYPPQFPIRPVHLPAAVPSIRSMAAGAKPDPY